MGAETIQKNKKEVQAVYCPFSEELKNCRSVEEVGEPMCGNCLTFSIYSDSHPGAKYIDHNLSISKQKTKFIFKRVKTFKKLYVIVGRLHRKIGKRNDARSV